MGCFWYFCLLLNSISLTQTETRSPPLANLIFLYFNSACNSSKEGISLLITLMVTSIGKANKTPMIPQSHPKTSRKRKITPWPTLALEPFKTESISGSPSTTSLQRPNMCYYLTTAGRIPSCPGEMYGLTVLFTTTALTETHVAVIFLPVHQK